MRKYLVMLIALVAAVAIAVPSFAVEFKYGGMYRWRIHANENMKDANSDLDDTANWIDQRLRLYFTFVGSENLQLVTKWEADTLWGLEKGAGRHGGGDWGADAVNLEMKNVYLDFMIPNTPVRALVGVQGLSYLDGWIVADDASAFVLKTAFDPVKVELGYIAGVNSDPVTDYNDMDDWFLALKYAEGPFNAAAVLFYQYAHDADYSYPNSIGYGGTGAVDKEDNHLVDLGFSLGYKMDWLGAKVNFVKNLGGYDIAGTDEDEDYEGWMVEAALDFYMGAFTFTLGGFWTSDDFAYPAGRSHYWAEIAGLGTLDVNVAGNDWYTSSYGMGGGLPNRGDYDAGDAPRNLWTIHAGVAWQALDTTKVTFNYYYLGTDDDVLANEATDEYDDSIGHELDLYIDHKLMDGLTLRLVGAYLIGDDALSTNEEDDNIYEVGARLLWKF
ncbi:hypothetical protein [Thermodesulforhabdus norvegica]|uniref:Alginate export domain-containing protein n=1 Tax=Thermodesulforhabdus norvegica TaxID=39841 RepID=A0A1I4SMG8_9BACT|nr:hypothetical protein [Thermodesulforhabdus norvegica]SFM65718.1 hypothetical protein SAMN05660836_01055 [Thermodesulforhabdus norvegica]